MALKQNLDKTLQNSIPADFEALCLLVYEWLWRKKFVIAMLNSIPADFEANVVSAMLMGI